MSEQTGSAPGERRRRREEERRRALAAEQAATVRVDAEVRPVPPAGSAHPGSHTAPGGSPARPSDAPTTPAPPAVERPLSRRELRERAAAAAAAPGPAAPAAPTAPTAPAAPARVVPPAPAAEHRPLSRRELRAAATDGTPPTGRTSPLVQPPAVTGAVRRVAPGGRLSDVEPAPHSDGDAPAGARRPVTGPANRPAVTRPPQAERTPVTERPAGTRVTDEQPPTLLSPQARALSPQARAAAIRAQAARAQGEREEAARLQAERAQVQRATNQRSIQERAGHEAAGRRGGTAATGIARSPEPPTVIAPTGQPLSGGRMPAPGQMGEGRVPLARIVPAPPEPARTPLTGPAPIVPAAGTPTPMAFVPADRVPPVGQTFGSVVLPTAPEAVAPVPTWPTVHPPAVQWSPTPLAGEARPESSPTEPAAAAAAVAAPVEDAGTAPGAEPESSEPAVLGENERLHPYTWLHMVVLVVVAFVLGMLILLVVRNDEQGTDDAASDTASVIEITASAADPASGYTTEPTGD